MDYILSRIFIDTYNNLIKFSNGKAKKIVVDDFDVLEKTLENYVVNIFGYEVKENYSNYFQEISKSFENIILNCNCDNYISIINSINEYGSNFYKNINDYKYASIFIETLKEFYSVKTAYPVIGNEGKAYYVTMLSKEEEQVPTTYIKDIVKFEDTLKNFVEIVLSSDTDFNKFFDGFEYDEAISYLFKWVVQNASLFDLSDIEQYFRKYSSFITDTTLDSFKKSTKLGKILGDDLYIAVRKANVNYETPFYLCFLVNGENRKVELPNIRLGIETKDGVKKAHIIATQSAQSPYDLQMNRQYDELLKCNLPKSKKFREYNPSHLVSLVLSIGFLKSLGIDIVEITDFMPLRYQRLIVENRKNDEELHNYQYRLTNKNLYNYFRMLEFQKGITISNYPDGGFNLVLKLKDDIKFYDTFLQQLFDTSYQMGIQSSKDETKKM